MTTDQCSTLKSALDRVIGHLKCTLCNLPFKNPHTAASTCGHTFCWDCVSERLEGPGINISMCPQCKAPLWKKDLVHDTQIEHLLTCTQRYCASARRDAGDEPEPLEETPSPGFQENYEPNVEKQPVVDKQPVPIPRAGRATKPVGKTNSKRAAKPSSRAADHAQNSSPAVGHQAQQNHIVPHTAGKSPVATMFDYEPADGANSPSAGCAPVKSASQQPQDSCCNAASESAHAGPGSQETGGSDADNAAPDWLATQAVLAPDWLATQAATQVAPMPSMAESQPFPFDFAALLPERPKPVHSPPKSDAAKEPCDADNVEKSVPDSHRVSTDPSEEQQRRKTPPSEPTRLARGSRRRPNARSAEAASKASGSAGAGAGASTSGEPRSADVSVGDIMSMAPGTAPRPAVKGVRMKRRRNTTEEEDAYAVEDDDWVGIAIDADGEHAKRAGARVSPHPLFPIAAAEDTQQQHGQHNLADAAQDAAASAEPRQETGKVSKRNSANAHSTDAADAPAVAAGRKGKVGKRNSAKEQPTAAAAAPIAWTGKGRRANRRRRAPDPAFSLSPLADTHTIGTKLSVEATAALPLPPQSQQSVLMPDIFAEVQEHLHAERTAELGAAALQPVLASGGAVAACMDSDANEHEFQIEIAGPPEPSHLGQESCLQDTDMLPAPESEPYAMRVEECGGGIVQHDDTAAVQGAADSRGEVEMDEDGGKQMSREGDLLITSNEVAGGDRAEHDAMGCSLADDANDPGGHCPPAEIGNAIEGEMGLIGDLEDVRDCTPGSSSAGRLVHEQPAVEANHGVDISEAAALEVRDSELELGGDRAEVQGDAAAGVADSFDAVPQQPLQAVDAVSTHAVAFEVPSESKGTGKVFHDSTNLSAQQELPDSSIQPAKYEGLGATLVPADHPSDAPDVCCEDEQGLLQQHLQPGADQHQSVDDAALPESAEVLQAPSAREHLDCTIGHLHTGKEDDLERERSMDISPKGSAELAAVHTPSSSLGPGFVPAAMLRDSQRALEVRAASASAGGASAGCSTSPPLQSPSQMRALTADEIMRCDEWANATAALTVTSPCALAEQLAATSDCVPSSSLAASFPSAPLPLVSATGQHPDSAPAELPSCVHTHALSQGVIDRHDHAASMPAFCTAADVSRSRQRCGLPGQDASALQSQPLSQQPEGGSTSLQQESVEEQHGVTVQVACDQVDGEAASQKKEDGAVFQTQPFVGRRSADSGQHQSPCLQQAAARESPACSTILARVRDWDSWTGARAPATQALWQELLSDLQKEMTPEVAAALHAEAHAMSRALSALNRAIAACKSHQRTSAPAAARNTTCVQLDDTFPQTRYGTGNPAMHAGITQSIADVALRSDPSAGGGQVAIALQPQSLTGRELQSSRLQTGVRDNMPTATAASVDVVTAATNATTSAATAAVEEAGRAAVPQQVAYSDSMHANAASHNSEPVAPNLSAGSLPQVHFQSESLMGSLHTLGSSGAGVGDGFQLGQQHLMAQDVEELLQQPSASTHPGDLPSNPVDGTAVAAPTGELASDRAPSESPARPRHDPQSQHTPPHSFSSGGRAWHTTGGPDLPGCIPDTPSGSEGPTGQAQQQLSPITMMRSDVPKHSPQPRSKLASTTSAANMNPAQPVVTPGQPKPETKRKSTTQAATGILGVSALRTSKETNVVLPGGEPNPPAKRSRLSRISRKAT